MDMASTEATARPSATPSVILLVDDDLDIRSATAGYLRGCGYRVLEAADVVAAISMFDNVNAPSGLIIASVEVPAMTGLALVRWVREHHPELPILLTSGSARTADLDDDLRLLGPIVSKPYRGDALARRVRGRLRTSDWSLDLVSAQSSQPGTQSNNGHTS